MENKYDAIKGSIVPVIITILVITSFIWYFFYSEGASASEDECVVDYVTGDCWY